MKRLIFSAILLIGFSGLILETESARAQSIFLEPNSGAAVQLEALRPNFAGLNLTNTSFTLFLSSRIKVGEDLQVRAEVPFSYFKRDEYYDPYLGNNVQPSQGENSIGNPYLGLEFGKSDNGFKGEAGIRIPVLADFNTASAIGTATDPVERMEAFADELLPIYFGANYNYKSRSGFAMRIRLVPVFWLYLNNTGGSRNNDIFALYSAQAWYEEGKVGVGGGFSGRVITTGDASGFGNRSLHQFGFFANYSFGQYMPGFQVRFPLDSDLKDSGMNPSYSLSIGIKL
ncbi:MAG: hypothetical protein ABFS42_08150 [Candidatus Krumholzibacteriota bacterium]